jgi:RNA polymerase sigma-70 factor, ECF subfamily
MASFPSKTRRSPHTATTAMARDVGTIGPWSERRDEELLVEYAEAKTREAFEELVHRYERELYGYLRRYLGSADLAEDVFQATFLQVHLNCRDFDPCRKFRPWLYRIATTRAIDLLRRDRRHKAVSLNAEASDIESGKEPLSREILDFRDAGPSRQLEEAEDRQRIRSAVDKFPLRLKDVLVLVMFQGLKYQEAADALGIPLGSVKSRLHEAVVRLRKQFAVPTRVVSPNNPGSCRGVA